MVQEEGYIERDMKSFLCAAAAMWDDLSNDDLTEAGSNLH